MRFVSAIGSLVSIALVGCVSPATDDPSGPNDPSDPSDPNDPPPPPPPPSPMASGTYKLRTTVGITAEVLLPEQVVHAIETLRAFSMNPADAILDLAEAEGVPAVGTLRDALPDTLENKLEDWINDEINAITIDGYPLTSYARDLALLAETAFGEIALDSELAISGATAAHRLVGVDLTKAGITAVVPLDLAGDLVLQNPTIATTSSALTIGAHTYGLAYGAYIWQGLEAMNQQSLGMTIRQTIGTAVNCPAVAQKVAEQCVASMCVGHAAELTSICEAGLDYVVAYAHDRVVAMRIDALELASGTALLVDGDHDLAVDGFTQGSWDASLNLGMGLRHAPATFTGTR